MTDLSRSLLNAAREGLAPDPAVAARVKAKVAAAVAAGGGAAAVTTAATTSNAATAVAPTAAATKAAGSTSLLLKLSAALLVVGTVATTAVVMQGDRSETPNVAVTPKAEVEELPAKEQLASHDVAPQASKIPRVKRVVSGAPIDERAIEIDEPASLSREVELIDQAMASLRGGAPAKALASIAVFEKETFGRGQMAEEAAAIEIEARCTLREDVAERLAAFDRKWPSSAQRTRLTAACRK